MNIQKIMYIISTVCIVSLYSEVEQKGITTKDSYVDILLEDKQTRDLDPRYILSALSGATTAVAELKEQKHPDEVHPVGLLAAILRETSKLVNYNIQKEEEKGKSRCIQGIDYTMELQALIDFLEKKQHDGKVLKKIMKYTQVMTEYIAKPSNVEKKAFFSAIYNDKEKKRKLLGEVLFIIGNYVADEVQQTAEVLIEDLYAIIKNDGSVNTSRKVAVCRSFDFASVESQLIDMVGDLIDHAHDIAAYKEDARQIEEYDAARKVIIEQLVEIAGVLKKALVQEESMLAFWQETPIIGGLISADGFDERKELVYEFIENDEKTFAFVQEFVYCMYHVIFNKLGKMLTIAYDALQDPLDKDFGNSFDEGEEFASDEVLAMNKEALDILFEEV